MDKKSVDKNELKNALMNDPEALDIIAKLDKAFRKLLEEGNIIRDISDIK